MSASRDHCSTSTSVNSFISFVFLQDAPAVSRRNSAAKHHLHPKHGGNKDAAGQPVAHKRQLHNQRLQDGVCQQSLDPVLKGEHHTYISDVSIVSLLL